MARCTSRSIPSASVEHPSPRLNSVAAAPNWSDVPSATSAPRPFTRPAHAVVARSFGYHVDRITTDPVTDVFDPLTGDIEDRIGHTLVLNLPDEVELHRPEHRLIAERYIIMCLVGPFAEAVSCGRKDRWRNSDDLRAVMPLVEAHAEWCQDRYLEWLKARTEMTFFGPAATEIFVVARKLVRQREMTGTEFGQFLRRRTREERKRASEREAYLAPRDGR